MSYRLRFDKQFMRRLETLPGDIRSLARKQIQALAQSPRPAQTKELDDHPTFYRLRLPRHHRLVYQVLDEEQIIDLLYIGLKSADLYDTLGLGRQPHQDANDE